MINSFIHLALTMTTPSEISNQSFDWALFWTAFAAIATLLGALATNIALIFAFQQLKQPTKKVIDFKFYIELDMVNRSYLDPYFVHLHIINSGLRNVHVQSYGIKIKHVYLDWVTTEHPTLNVKEKKPFVEHVLIPDASINITFSHNESIEIFTKYKRIKTFQFACMDINGTVYTSSKMNIKKYINIKKCPVHVNGRRKYLVFEKN